MAAAQLKAFGPGFGQDGGFWVMGADGKLHWVPPWDPEITRDMGLAATLVNLAPQFAKNAALQKQIVGLAETLGNAHAPAIAQHLSNLTR
jgi:hypothetical protein